MRQELRTQLAAARARTDRLFDLLAPGAIYDRPIPDRHRLIFYLGHLEAFDWNLVGRGNLDLPAFHPSFDSLFAFGIDPPEGCAPQDTPSDWPSIAEIHAYNRRVRQELDNTLDPVPEQLIHVALEHRWMHAETILYLLQSLPVDRLLPPAGPAPEPDAPASRPPVIDIPAGQATLGRRHEDGFGWDNEFEAIRLDVPSFRIAKYKVTNGDYLEFVRAGADPPHFWCPGNGGAFHLRTMFAEIPLPLNWPVYVTLREAEDYARWAGRKLPAEAQFHRAAFGTPEGLEREYPWGDDPPAHLHGNFDFARWDPEPVTASPQGDSAFGVSQLVGNGWEWTSSPFAPFPGFQPFPFYPGYSANFFDGDHFVIKGGSPHTAAPLLRRSFRNWFRPTYPYVHAGFRLVEDESK